MANLSVRIDGEDLRITNLETGDYVWAVRCNDEHSLWRLEGAFWGVWQLRYPTFEELLNEVKGVSA